MPARLLAAPPMIKMDFSAQIQNARCWDKRIFSDGCASIMVPFPCPFFPAGGREKAGHRNGFVDWAPTPSAVSSWKPLDPRCPGVLCPSTAGCRVVDRPVVVTPALEKPVACLTSFSDSWDWYDTLPCLLLIPPILSCGWEPPCFRIQVWIDLISGWFTIYNPNPNY